MVSDLNRVLRSADNSVLAALKGARGVTSSVMVWTPSVQTDSIYRKFVPHADKVMANMSGGDQDWIPSRVRVSPLKGVHSFKADLNCGSPRPDTSVVIFHGRPNPDEVDLSWVKEHWKA